MYVYMYMYMYMYMHGRWGQWKDILYNGRYKKRQLSTKDIENISRTMVRTYTCIHA